jgi:hypothetical protein
MANRIDNPWHAVLDDALVCRFLLNEKNENDPKQALNDIIAWETMVSQDPAVNGADYARGLIQQLADAIDSGIPLARLNQSPLMVEVDAYLAHPTGEENFND